MTPKRLQYFLKVLEAGSISRAAETLGIAQPALSQHMAALEAEIGTALLERRPRGVVATPAGQRFVEHAQTILRLIDHAKSSVGSALPAGPVTLVLASAGAEVLAVPLLRRVSARFLEIDLRLREMFSGDALELVRDAQVDLALLRLDTPPTTVATRAVYSEYFYLFGRVPGSPDRFKDIPFAKLAGLPLALPTPRHGMRATLAQAGLDQGVALDIRTEQDSMLLLQSFIETGYAYSILPWSSVGRLIDDPEIVARRVVRPTVQRTVSLAWPRLRPLSRAAAEVEGVLMEIVGEALATGTLKGKAMRT